jgi:hypothetical protein
MQTRAAARRLAAHRLGSQASTPAAIFQMGSDLSNTIAALLPFRAMGLLACTSSQLRTSLRKFILQCKTLRRVYRHCKDFADHSVLKWNGKGRAVGSPRYPGFNYVVSQGRFGPSSVPLMFLKIDQVERTICLQSRIPMHPSHLLHSECTEPLPPSICFQIKIWLDIDIHPLFRYESTIKHRPGDMYCKHNGVFSTFNLLLKQFGFRLIDGREV